MTGRAHEPEAKADDRAATRPPAGPNSPERAPRQPPVKEIGGPKGPEPTRYGDWEKGGRCSDF